LPNENTVFDGILADLAALGLAASGEGRAALVLASRLDDQLGEESTAALAAAARELRMIMNDLRGRPVGQLADPLDELEAKRARRRTG
jgi:phosphoribosyl-dephospho-CoA transferase